MPDEKNTLAHEQPSQPENKRYAVREGAGLDDARVNQDFIDALQKYGGWVLIIAALAMGAYAGWNYLEKQRTQTRQAAYAELADAQLAGSPDTLLRVATSHDGEGSVSILARLQAADLYLKAYRTGLMPGAQLTPEGVPASDADVLNDEQKSEQLSKAESQYKAVYDKAKGNDDYALHTIGSLYGLAAVAESRGQLDEAKTFYTQIIELSEKAQLPLPGQTAKARIDSLDALKADPKLYDKAEVLALAPPPAPPAPAEPAPGAGGMTPNGDGTFSMPGMPGVLTPVNPEDVPGDVREPQGQPADPAPTP